jgi:hypothetical protein
LAQGCAREAFLSRDMRNEKEVITFDRDRKINGLNSNAQQPMFNHKKKIMLHTGPQGCPFSFANVGEGKGPCGSVWV